MSRSSVDRKLGLAIQLVKNVKSAGCGAGGPSGITAEHLRPFFGILKQIAISFGFLGQALAQTHIPEEVLTALRMGRITALQKPSVGIKGIVVGDLVRRLVSRTIAQQIGPHMLQVRTDLDDLATVFRSMASEHSMWCLASLCFEVCCEWREVTTCCRLGANSMLLKNNDVPHKGDANIVLCAFLDVSTPSCNPD